MIVNITLGDSFTSPSLFLSKMVSSSVGFLIVKYVAVPYATEHFSVSYFDYIKGEISLNFLSVKYVAEMNTSIST